MAGEEDDQYQKRMRKRVTEALRAAQIEQQKKDILRRFLDGTAYDRMMNIRVSNQELYDQLVSLIVQLVQSNRITGKMTENQLKSLLTKATYKKEPTISFKHK
jgi:DNA-binding TFAR19-related protein (PDSD5 family)